MVEKGFWYKRFVCSQSERATYLIVLIAALEWQFNVNQSHWREMVEWPKYDLELLVKRNPGIGK